MKIFDDSYFFHKFTQTVAEYGIHTLVETGTYRGDFISIASTIVNHCISIEIQRQFFEGTKARFISEGYSQVPVPEYIQGVEAASYAKGRSTITLICGNSPEVISTIIKRLPEPILFYLDAHSMPEALTEYLPIKDEIRAIKPRPNSLIIIDDFKVPGKPWQYDTYGEVALDYDLIKDDLAFTNPDYIIFYNEESDQCNRGMLFAVPPKDVQAEDSDGV